jgi:hypothetical protein
MNPSGVSVEFLTGESFLLLKDRKSNGFSGYPGKRIVVYDNERGKGDHQHIKGRERSYEASTVGALICDFLSDVRHARGES